METTVRHLSDCPWCTLVLGLRQKVPPAAHRSGGGRGRSTNLTARFGAPRRRLSSGGRPADRVRPTGSALKDLASFVDFFARKVFPATFVPLSRTVSPAHDRRRSRDRKKCRLPEKASNRYGPIVRKFQACRSHLTDTYRGFPRRSLKWFFERAVQTKFESSPRGVGDK